jgi:hypothetical protein
MTQKPNPGSGRPKADPEVRAARNQRAAKVEAADDAPWDPTPVLMARIYDVPMPEGTDIDWYGHTYQYAHQPADPSHKQLVTLWLANRDVVIEAYSHELPGERPVLWWLFEAPRITEIPPGWGGWVLRQWRQLRARVAGAGEAYVPHLNPEYGVPTHWLAEGFDPSDPPIFESQAAYLKRNGMLLRGEALRLTAKDFKPVPLPKHLWPVPFRSIQ